MDRRRTLVAVGGLMLLGVVALTAARSPQRPGANAPSGDVRDHGAKGDGVADDTAAVQAAVDSGAGVVRLPKGVYRVTKPVVIDLDKTGITAITGDTVARVVMAGDGPAFRLVGTHAGTAAPATVKPGVWDRQRMPSVDGVEIVGDHPSADGIAGTGTMKLTITRVLVRRCRHGIHLTGRNRNVTISDCHVYQNRGVGIFLDAVNLHQINVTGCHVSYNDGGGIACVGGEVRNLQITGCDIESNHGKDGPPTANVLVDSTGGTNAEVAITGNTIQHNHTAPGSANVRIKGPTIPDKKTPERRDGHVTITGNVLSDVATNIHLTHARGVVITGNTAWMAFGHNLLVEDSAHVVVGANGFERNPRYAYGDSESASNAVLFKNSADCTITGLHVSRVTGADAGVAFENCDRFNISNLTVLDCDRAAVSLKDVTNSRLSGCLIRDDRPGASSVSVRTSGGRDTAVTDNYLGRPHDILGGVGVVARNVEPWRK